MLLLYEMNSKNRQRLNTSNPITCRISNWRCQHIRSVEEDQMSFEATSLMLNSLRRSIKPGNYINCLIRWPFWRQISSALGPGWWNFHHNIVQNSKLGRGLQNIKWGATEKILPCIKCNGSTLEFVNICGLWILVQLNTSNFVFRIVLQLAFLITS